MSWIAELVKVYDNTIGRTGDKPYPIYHIANNASITVILDRNGKFQKAEKIESKDRENRVTCMPCTESSASRTSGADAYPLCDKLEYVCGNSEKHEKYIHLLKNWAESQWGTEKIKAVFSYISAGTLEQDLESCGIKKDDILNFIRWRVEIPGDLCPDLWKDPVIQESWIHFYNSEDFDIYCKNNFSQKKDIDDRVRKFDLDYITGEKAKIAVYHPSKIRNSGDSAKLISSNDIKNFTFRGRFFSDNEACQISSDATQKAHSALRWLMGRQGASIGNGLSVVSWNESGSKLPSLVSTDDFAFEDLFTDEKISEYNTAMEFAKKLRSCLLGYYKDVRNSQNIMVMAIKEAIPGKGRVSIVLYRELQKSDMLEALNKWYGGLTWYITYKNKKERKDVHSIGFPFPEEIAKCAYGERIKPDLLEKTIQRILPCILDGTVIPLDLEKQCVRNASNLSIQKDKFLRCKILETACAVYKYNQIIKTHNEEVYTLALDETRTSRDYLYGRLLAVVHQEEKKVLFEMKETRETNALRYMQQFSMKPATTWKILYEKLLPYKRRLSPGISEWFEKKIQDISALFSAEDYMNDKPLSGEYLLGFQCQLKDFRKKTEEETLVSKSEEV